jgi:hypothetical protein
MESNYALHAGHLTTDAVSKYQQNFLKSTRATHGRTTTRTHTARRITPRATSMIVFECNGVIEAMPHDGISSLNEPSATVASGTIRYERIHFFRPRPETKHTTGKCPHSPGPKKHAARRLWWHREVSGIPRAALDMSLTRTRKEVPRQNGAYQEEKNMEKEIIGPTVGKSGPPAAPMWRALLLIFNECFACDVGLLRIWETQNRITPELADAIRALDYYLDIAIDRGWLDGDY